MLYHRKPAEAPAATKALLEIHFRSERLPYAFFCTESKLHPHKEKGQMRLSLGQHPSGLQVKRLLGSNTCALTSFHLPRCRKDVSWLDRVSPSQSLYWRAYGKSPCRTTCHNPSLEMFMDQYDASTPYSIHLTIPLFSTSYRAKATDIPKRNSKTAASVVTCPAIAAYLNTSNSGLE